MVLDISLSSDNYDTNTKTFYDRSGLGNNGVSSNNAVFTNGRYGSADGAMNFDGSESNDYIFINRSMDIVDTYTASAWVKPDFSNPNSDHITFGFSVFSNDNHYPLWLTVKIDGSVVVRSWTSNNSGYQTGSGLITENNWHHIVVTAVKGGETKIYVDGKLKNVFINDGVGTWTNRFFIGELRNNRNLNFDGLIDDVGLYNYALTEEEVKNLYDNGRSVASLPTTSSDGLVGHWSMDEQDYNSTNNRVGDKTSFENHGTNSGATFTTDRFGKEGGAMSFDGSNYINAGNSNILNTNSRTISAWIKTDNTGTENNSGTIISKIANISPHNGFTLNVNRVIAGKVYYYAGSWYETNSSDYNDGNWHHIVVIHEGASLKFYKDGVLD
ncbi:MAG: hypothetical protein PWQ35_570, partial [Patescibacteria group bacterium]|nr:hypothetical protein [Patescibacteria group bacterium]